MPGKIWFVGAGPGDPDLITVKGRKLLEQSGAILYAGSLVDQAATLYAPAAARSATRRT
jgi:precorrin-4/cobalt-precorrin-4 C11-methyltransferase